MENLNKENEEMGYMKINNLYKDQRVMAFKELYSLEKIHGSSSHISFKDNELQFFGGGEKHEKFVSIFDADELIEKFTRIGVPEVKVHGEVYGGKQQGMKGTYGDQTRFVAFDVKMGENWLSVEKAEKVVLDLGLEFVHYVKIPATLEAIDAERDKPSTQAMRNGLGEVTDKFGHCPPISEGVVLKPLEEMTGNNGARVMCKHKRNDFMETKTPRTVDPEKLKVLSDARDVAEEWVVEMRLNHVLDKIEDPCMEKMPEIIKAMMDDVKVEGEGEIIWSSEVSKAIGKQTAILTKKYFQDKLKEDYKES